MFMINVGQLDEVENPYTKSYKAYSLLNSFQFIVNILKSNLRFVVIFIEFIFNTFVNIQDIFAFVGHQLCIKKDDIDYPRKLNNFSIH